MDAQDRLQQIVEARFRNYLTINNMRQTPERFAILRKIYEISGTFTIEQLEQAMTDSNYRVAQATLYTTTALLVKANLLIRHPFSSTTTIFERIADDQPRCYQICSECHRITRIKGKEFLGAVQSYKPRLFSTSHRVAYIYGVCPQCRKKIKQLEQRFLIF